MPHNTKTLQTASVRWEQNQPVSDQFDDIYYSKDSGIDESRYVFIQANQLSERLSRNTNTTFTVAETGFGTGLNFLLSWHLWRTIKEPNKPSLNFISFEKYPLTSRDLSLALSNWPELSELTPQLIDKYPAAVPGTHRLCFENDAVTLTLIFGDATQEIQKADFFADVWYLDGFAPAKNQEMWNDTLFQQIAARSHPGTTLSTFTSAGFIRRGLASHGFNMKKIAGFGQKREMLVGQFMDARPDSSQPKSDAIRKPQRVAIIGAGIAGATTANTLAKRGFQVDVYEKNSRPAQEGSGNRQGVLYIKPGRTFSSQYEWSITAYQFALQFYNSAQNETRQCFWNPCGVLNSSFSEEEVQRNRLIAESTLVPKELITLLGAQDAEKLSGVSDLQESLHFPKGGWISPGIAIEHLLSHPNISVFKAQSVDKIQHQSHTNQWTVTSQQRSATYEYVVICGAYHSQAFIKESALQLTKIAGQTSILPASNIRPQTVICGDGYICPPSDNQICFGATFHPKANNVSVCDDDHRANIRKLGEWLPGFAEAYPDGQTNATDGHAAFRCSTRDYHPVVGRASNEIHNLESKAAQTSTLFLNCGHGSKGLVSAPISAQYIADLIERRPSPLSSPIESLIKPDRFLRRKSKTGL